MRLLKINTRVRLRDAAAVAPNLQQAVADGAQDAREIRDKIASASVREKKKRGFSCLQLRQVLTCEPLPIIRG